MDVWTGKQQQLAWSVMPEFMKEKQEKEVQARLKAIEKRYSKNFYVLDTETNGLKDNEPI